MILLCASVSCIRMDSTALATVERPRRVTYGSKHGLSAVAGMIFNDGNSDLLSCSGVLPSDVLCNEVCPSQIGLAPFRQGMDLGIKVQASIELLHYPHLQLPVHRCSKLLCHRSMCSSG